MQIKENIKGPCHWPLCGEFTGTGKFPAQRASNAENGPIWWRHHDVLGDRERVYDSYAQSGISFAVFHNPDSMVHGANMGPIWGRQDPDGPHVGPMNFAIWET